MTIASERTMHRRVAGYHDIRLDGITDLVLRAPGAAVFDIGCNRGLVAFEMANNGARLVHGCDNYEPGIETARQVFADLRACESKFEVVDLTRGRKAIATAFGEQRYDITLMLATLHKISRDMDDVRLRDLMAFIGSRTTFFGWRATSDKPDENEREMEMLDGWLRLAGLTRIHTSRISAMLGVAAIWARGY